MTSNVETLEQEKKEKKKDKVKRKINNMEEPEAIPVNISQIDKFT